MAEKEELDEDLDLGEEKQGGSKKKLIIIIAAVSLVVILGGVGAWFFLSGDDGDTPESAQTEEAGDKGDKTDSADGAVEKGPAIYLSLEPVFVVNLAPETGAKMMQVGVDVMVRSPELAEFVQTNDPMIRNQLLNLFGSQNASKLRDRAGKERLQEKVRDEIQKVVKGQGGPGEIEAVYFSSFVMQ